MNKSDMIAALLAQDDFGSMWRDRAVAMVEALDGTGIAPDDDAGPLLDKLLIARNGHPKIAALLDCLPGLSTGDRSEAERQLSFLTMQVKNVTSQGEDC